VKEKEKNKLNNYTIQHNKTQSIDRLSRAQQQQDFRTYSLNPICQITSISTVRQIKQASNVTKSTRTTGKAWTKGYCQSHILWEIS